jgi:hypothetical protein
MTDASGETKIVKEKIDEAMSRFKETGKGYGFGICSNGKQISTTEIKEGDGKMNSCPENQIGSFNIHPGIKDVPPSPKDITPDIPKI